MSGAHRSDTQRLTNADSTRMQNGQKQILDAQLMAPCCHLLDRVILGHVSNNAPPPGCYLLTPITPPTPQKARGTKQPPTPSKPYVKKPPNAFMLFMKEQRPFAKAQLEHLTGERKDSASVNKILGQMWKSLSQDEQFKYYMESDRLNQIHASLHPEWSCRDNYGQKRKRVWCKTKKSEYTNVRPYDSVMGNNNTVHVPDNPAPAPPSVTYAEFEAPKADLSGHLAVPMQPLFPYMSTWQAGPNEDPDFTIGQGLEMSLFSSPSIDLSISSLHEDEEDLTSALFRQLVAMEAAEASSAF